MCTMRESSANCYNIHPCFCIFNIRFYVFCGSVNNEYVWFLCVGGYNVQIFYVPQYTCMWAPITDMFLLYVDVQFFMPIKYLPSVCIWWVYWNKSVRQLLSLPLLVHFLQSQQAGSNLRRTLFTLTWLQYPSNPAHVYMTSGQNLRQQIRGNLTME